MQPSAGVGNVLLSIVPHFHSFHLSEFTTYLRWREPAFDFKEKMNKTKILDRSFLDVDNNLELLPPT